MINVTETTMSWAKANQIRHWYKPETTSTNAIAKEENLDEFKLYFTAEQSAGRGRGNNDWLNTASKNSLLSTWSYSCNHTPQHFLPALIGIALFRATKATWSSLPWSLKAPNDLYIGDKKVAGLLIETVQQGTKVNTHIGLGLNIFSAPADLESATHLSQALGDKSEINSKQWEAFLTLLKQEFDSAISKSNQPKIDEAIREEILEALNANPWKPDVYLEVSDQGDLVTESKTIHWTEL